MVKVWPAYTRAIKYSSSFSLTALFKKHLSVAMPESSKQKFNRLLVLLFRALILYLIQVWQSRFPFNINSYGDLCLFFSIEYALLSGRKIFWCSK